MILDYMLAIKTMMRYKIMLKSYSVYQIFSSVPSKQQHYYHFICLGDEMNLSTLPSEDDISSDVLLVLL